MAARNFRVSTIKNTSFDFYVIMGRYLSKREIVKELGYPVWDDDGKVWVLAEAKKLGVVGFLGLVFEKKQTRISNLYVLPDHRKLGIATALVEHAKTYLKKEKINLPIVTTASNEGVRVFKKLGFKEYGKAGSFTKMQKPS